MASIVSWLLDKLAYGIKLSACIRPPESYSSVENGRKYYLRKYYFYISMEILLGENGQLGAFPDLLFEYFQIICPWKYYGAKTDLFNIGIL